MEEYEEINEEAKELDLTHKLLYFVSHFAGRDMLLSPMPKSLSKAIDTFKQNVIETILGKLNLVELFLCRKELKDFVTARCDLELDAYGRVNLFYKGEKIGSFGFNYREGDLDKNEIKVFFQNAIETNRDVCLEIKMPNKTLTDLIVIRHENLKEELAYYLENLDDELRLQDGSNIQIIEILLFHFVA